MTEVHGGIRVMAFRWIIMNRWQAWARVHMVNHWIETAWEHVVTKIMDNWGTWELNPGPNTHQPRPLPTEPLHSFVNIIEHKEYI